MTDEAARREAERRLRALGWLKEEEIAPAVDYLAPLLAEASRWEIPAGDEPALIFALESE